MTKKTRILIVADSTEALDHLAKKLLPQAGYEVTTADDFKEPGACDLMVVHVTRLRGSPLARLKAQRRMGCMAEAILFAPRLTGEMAQEVFELGVRDYVTSPVDDETLLKRLATFVEYVQKQHSHNELRHSLAETEGSLKRRLEEMNALSRIGRTIASLKDVDEILAHIVEAAVYLTRADEGAIFLLDEESKTLLLRAEQGFGEKRAEAIRRPSTDSDVVGVLETAKPIMRNADTEHKMKTGYMVRALVNVPIILERQVVGVIGVYNLGTHSFEESDQTVLVNLAEFSSVALDKARALVRYKEQVDEALDAARVVGLHAETLYDPIEGIDSLVETLLKNGFDPLSEKQRTAISRIRQALIRLKEISGLIKQTLADFEKDTSK